MPPSDPKQQNPSHPDLLTVLHAPGSFSSKAVSKVSLPPGALFAHIASPPMNIVAQKRYSTVQVSQTQHIELNCDFLYINHSCEPSLEFHVSTDPKRGPAIDLVVAERTDATGMTRGIKEGDDLTFFYPSTEWEMAQPFECTCRTPSCKGVISGAKHMRLGDLQPLYLSPHIEEMLRTEGLKN